MRYDLDKAPRTAAGFAILDALLADGEWHTITEAIEAVGLAPRTLHNMTVWGSRTGRYNRHTPKEGPVQVRLRPTSTSSPTSSPPRP